MKNLVKTYLGSPSVQAIYNDDQLSDNTFTNNTFSDCHDGLFIGGGRRHVVRGNRFIRVGTPFHLDDRGESWQKDYCSPPDGHFWTELNGLNYKSPPYSLRYPELLNIDRPCVPVHNVIEGNTWCGSSNFADVSATQAKGWGSTLSGNKEDAAMCAAPPPDPARDVCTWDVTYSRSDKPSATQVQVVHGARADTLPSGAARRRAAAGRAACRSTASPRACARWWTAPGRWSATASAATASPTPWCLPRR